MGLFSTEGKNWEETYDNKLISKLISETNAIKNAIKKTQRWEFLESSEEDFVLPLLRACVQSLV